jgi:hypothetical protein
MQERVLPRDFAQFVALLTNNPHSGRDNMTDPRREREGGSLTTPEHPQKQAGKQQHADRTAGTDRDYDDSGEAANQGHGHPREERDSGSRPDDGRSSG